MCAASVPVAVPSEIFRGRMAGTTLQETAGQGGMRVDAPGEPFLRGFANFVAKVASSLVKQEWRF